MEEVGFMKRLFCMICLVVFGALGSAAPAGAVAPTVEWEKVYGDTARELAYWIEEHSYNGYVVCGYTQPDSAYASTSAFLMRLNSSGDTLWTKTFGDTPPCVATCVRETHDGGYILGGYIDWPPADVDAWFVRTDASGDTLWTSRFDLWGDDFIYEVEETDDGGFISVGFTAKNAPTATTDVVVLKLDSDGDGHWKLICGGPGQQRGFSICQEANGDYVVAGYAEVGTDPYDLLLLKLDGEDGDSLWAKTYGDTATREIARSIRRSGDGLIVGGALTAVDPELSYGLLMRTDGNGDTLWTRTFGDTSSYTTLRSVRVTPDLGYICVGGLDEARDGNSDYYFIKTDSWGDTLWTKTVGGDLRDYPVCVTTTNDLGYAAVGYRRDLAGSDYDVYMVKLGMDEAGVGPTECDRGWKLLTVEGANPLREEVSVSYDMRTSGRAMLAVFDVGGRLVAELEGGTMEEGLHRVTWDCRDRSGRSVPSGVYFIGCRAAGLSGAVKVVVLR
jgi:hypothetical protein